MIEYNGDLIGGVGDTWSTGGPGPIVRWRTFGWQQFGNGPGLTAAGASVSSLAEYRGALFASGGFSSNGQDGNVSIVRLDGSNWIPVAGANSGVFALCVFHDELFAGGFGLASWDGTTWHSIGAELDGDIFAMTVYNDELIAAGAFEATFDGQPLNHIAAWNGAAWRPLGDGMNHSVWALAVHDGRLIAGGEFWQAGQELTGGIAQWDGTTWAPVGTGLFDGAVYCLKEHQNDLIAAGSIDQAPGAPATGIARWDGSTWQALDQGIPPYAIGPAWGALGQHGGTLFVSGGFTRAGGRISPQWARWGPRAAGDINLDGQVDLSDFYMLLENFGMSVDAATRDGDTDDDGDVDLADLVALLSAFGTTCP